MTESVLQHPTEILQTVFGYNQFRPLQEEVIHHLIAGNNGLVILPTGGGKSLCFQIPALMLDGITLVVSPLIALMKDQVEALRANGVAAYAINSSQSREEKEEIHHLIQQGKIKLLYISPEKALAPAFVQYLCTLPIRLIAIDEAHCVSMWGNDFRPEYAQLKGMFKHFPNTPRLALTATADPATQQDICAKLDIEPKNMFLGSFERPNLFLEVQPAQQRLEEILFFLRDKRDQAGIIYCLSRKSTESLAEKLQSKGFKASAYHAHLSNAERNRVQEGFLKDKIQIVCATIAFGMGIDKPNIRWVIHYSLPKNVESYYQEIGRAGRDGLPARTLLFAGYGDVISYSGMINDSDAPEEFKQVQLSKLHRMFDYTQANSCRTHFILSYFGEHIKEACGHCDHCKNPPATFDGTLIAQKALSAVKRTREEISINLLADILRGAQTQQVFYRNYHQIKTFGTGKDIPRDHWLQYITQLINRGFLSIDFTDYNKLKVTAQGESVLFDGQKVNLVSAVESFKTGKTVQPVKIKPKDLYRQELLQKLRIWRAAKAEETSLAPANLLGDETLLELANSSPVMRQQLSQITGFSEHKMQQFGQEVLQVIRSYFASQDHVLKVKGSTYLETLQYVHLGLDVDTIAQKRELSPSTIYGHLLQFYEHGEPFDIKMYIDEASALRTGQTWESLGKPDTLAPLFDILPPESNYNVIRLELIWYQRRG
jgi:ATP-dependent DNA helicase RecQ